MADLARARTGIAALYEKVVKPTAIIEPYARSGVQLIRSQGEAVITGSVLALIEQRLMDGSLDYQGKYPVDGIAAVLGMIVTMSLANDHDGLTVDARNITSDLTTVFSYRQATKWLKARESAPTVHAHGDNVDPILACADAL
jgi:hypothetical protein